MNPRSISALATCSAVKTGRGWMGGTHSRSVEGDRRMRSAAVESSPRSSYRHRRPAKSLFMLFIPPWIARMPRIQVILSVFIRAIRGSYSSALEASQWTQKIISPLSSASTAKSPSSSAAPECSAGRCAMDWRQAGATVVVAGRSKERGDQRVAAIEVLGGKALFMPVEADSRESVTQLKEQVLRQFGQVDCLINGAGVNAATPYEKIPDEEWHKVVNSSLLTTHLGCQAFAHVMAAQSDGGSILNIGSVTAHIPLSRVFAYSAVQSGRRQPDEEPGPRVRTKKSPSQRPLPRLFSRRAEPQNPRPGAGRQHHAADPRQTFWRTSRARRRGPAAASRKAGSFITGEDMYVDGGFTSMRF